MSRAAARKALASKRLGGKPSNYPADLRAVGSGIGASAGRPTKHEKRPGHRPPTQILPSLKRPKNVPWQKPLQTKAQQEADLVAMGGWKARRQIRRAKTSRA